MQTEWNIRPERPEDFDSIDRIIVAASRGDSEAADLVRRLRSHGDVLIALVAEIESRIVGHIMMSRMWIETAAGDLPAVALAPLMVDPPFQNRGIGSGLSREALMRCRDANESMAFVLGHPSYYPRFGFSAALTTPLEIPFTLSMPGAFMGLELKARALDRVQGIVKYPGAFGLPRKFTIDHESAITIRPFEEADEPILVKVWLRSGKAAYPFLPAFQALTPPLAADVFRSEIRANFDVWVLLQGKTIAGYLAFRDSYISRLYIDPNVQRSNCGTRLLDFAKRIHPAGLRLHTHQRNLPARAFYEKNGFHAIRFGVSPVPECEPDVEYEWAGDTRFPTRAPTAMGQP